MSCLFVCVLGSYPRRRWLTVVFSKRPDMRVPTDVDGLRLLRSRPPVNHDLRSCRKDLEMSPSPWI